VGGVTGTGDALQYLLAGASLVQIGTATFADPRAAQRVVAGIASYGERTGLESVTDLIGAYRAEGDAVSAHGGRL
jgi:dihydroorotate dehydrogenase (NAD+) catalytic subunit